MPTTVLRIRAVFTMAFIRCCSRSFLLNEIYSLNIEIMKSKDQKQFEKIQDAVLVECSISCQKCNKTVKEHDTDDYWMTYNLIQKGWTVKRNKILCDVCS